MKFNLKFCLLVEDGFQVLSTYSIQIQIQTYRIYDDSSGSRIPIPPVNLTGFIWTCPRNIQKNQSRIPKRNRNELFEERIIFGNWNSLHSLCSLCCCYWSASKVKRLDLHSLLQRSFFSHSWYTSWVQLLTSVVRKFSAITWYCRRE